LKWFFSGVVFAPLFAFALLSAKDEAHKGLFEANGPLRSSFVWDGARWSPAGDLPVQATDPQMVLLSPGEVLLVAPEQQQLTALRWSSGTWRAIAPPEQRASFVLLRQRSGRALLLQTESVPRLLPSLVDAYEGESWRSLPGPQPGDVQSAAVLSDGSVLALMLDALSCQPSLLASFDGTAWTQLAPPPAMGHSALLALPHGEALAALGGWTDPLTRLAFFAGRTFRKLPEPQPPLQGMPIAVGDLLLFRTEAVFGDGTRHPLPGEWPVYSSVTALDGHRLMVTGGGDFIADAAVWDLERGTATPLPPMPVARAGHGSAALLGAAGVAFSRAERRARAALLFAAGARRRVRCDRRLRRLADPLSGLKQNETELAPGAGRRSMQAAGQIAPVDAVPRRDGAAALYRCVRAP